MARTTSKDELLESARRCIEIAKQKGAQQVAVSADVGREVGVTWRDGKVEKVQEATTRGISLELYVDGRFGEVRTGDLRPDALETFITEAVAMTRSIAADPFRTLPDPKLYEGQAKIDLQIDDPAITDIQPERRRALVKELEEAARSVKGAKDILSVTTDFGDARYDSWRVNSNGFEGRHRSGSVGISAAVSVKDADGKKPEDWSAATTRYMGDLPDAKGIGIEATQRALTQRGSKKIDSGVMSMAVDQRAAGRLVSALVAPLSGASLQQKRSFLEGKLGTRLGSDLFTLVDEPHLIRGLGSRLFDGEGIATKVRPVYEKGVLRTYLIDTYYAKKLKVDPTSGSFCNLIIPPGARSAQDLLNQMRDGILVTGFLGGNSNATTGDYSFGVQGFHIVKGQRAEPISEMNISGNLGDLFTRLVAVGDDPYPYSRVKTPTMIFEKIQFAGN